MWPFSLGKSLGRMNNEIFGIIEKESAVSEPFMRRGHPVPTDIWLYINWKTA